MFGSEKMPPLWHFCPPFLFSLQLWRVHSLNLFLFLVDGGASKFSRFMFFLRGSPELTSLSWDKHEFPAIFIGNWDDIFCENLSGQAIRTPTFRRFAWIDSQKKTHRYFFAGIASSLRFALKFAWFASSPRCYPVFLEGRFAKLRRARIANRFARIGPLRWKQFWISDFSSRPWRNLPPTWVIHMATRRPAHNTPIHMDLVPFFKRTTQEIHVDRRVVGWSAGRHVDHPCGGQISPWPA